MRESFFGGIMERNGLVATSPMKRPSLHSWVCFHA